MTELLLRPEAPARAPAPLSVSVVICSYTEDRWDDLVIAVSSAWAQTQPPTEVIVVVDHSDALFERARRELPRTTVIASAGPPGLAGARNSGLAVAGGDVVAFLDDDAAADPRWLEKLAATYDRGTSEGVRVAGVGGRVTPRWQSARPGWFPPEFDWVVGCSYVGLPTGTSPVRNFIGANMSFRRDVLETAGGFSVELGRQGANGLGCEETELCIRAGDTGALVYEPAAEVHHRVPDARATWAYFLRRCYGEGRSKAVVSKLVGDHRALQSERRYLSATIPLGVFRALGALIRGRLSALATLVALFAGVTATATGYGVERVRLTRRDLSAWSASVSVPAAVQVAAGVAVVAAVIELWGSVLVTGVPLGKMSALGLLSVLPVRFWVGLALLTASFVYWAFRPRGGNVITAAHVVVLIAMLHATPTILYGTLRYSWAWKHVGIVSYILGHHGVDIHQASLSAYQDWPGFFAVNAMVVQLLGLHSALQIAPWGPPVNELLYLGPLLLIVRHFTADRRRQWTAVWLFYLGNWVGQDYFSPQGFAFFFYLVAIALCLRWFGGGRLPAPLASASGAMARLGQLLPRLPRVVDRVVDRVVPGAPVESPAWPVPAPPPPSFGVRAMRYGVMALLVVVIAASHQLTPFMLLSALVLLAVFGRLRQRSLPVLAAVITAAWIVLAGRTFLSQNIGWVVKSIGTPLENTGSTLVNLSKVSHDQVLVAEVDRLLTAGVVALAIYGYLRVRRGTRARHFATVLLLVVAPVVALVANSYGGEMLFRVYLFGLPFFAVLGAMALAPGRHWGVARSAIVTVVVVGLMAAGFSFAYYGKEQMNYFGPDEVQAMQTLYALAPSGSLIVGATSNLPWAFEHYAAYRYEWFAYESPDVLRPLLADPVDTLANDMAPYPHAYLVFSQSQRAELEATGLMSPADFFRIEMAITNSPRFSAVVVNQDVVILTLAPAGPAVPGSKPVGPGIVNTLYSGGARS